MDYPDLSGGLYSVPGFPREPGRSHCALVIPHSIRSLLGPLPGPATERWEVNTASDPSGHRTLSELPPAASGSRLCHLPPFLGPEQNFAFTRLHPQGCYTRTILQISAFSKQSHYPSQRHFKLFRSPDCDLHYGFSEPRVQVLSQAVFYPARMVSAEGGCLCLLLRQSI